LVTPLIFYFRLSTGKAQTKPILWLAFIFVLPLFRQGLRLNGIILRLLLQAAQCTLPLTKKTGSFTLFPKERRCFRLIA
jgi:hypothetical protein